MRRGAGQDPPSLWTLRAPSAFGGARNANEENHAGHDGIRTRTARAGAQAQACRGNHPRCIRRETADGPRVGRRRPAGRHLRGRRAAGARRHAGRARPQRARRVRRRVVGRLRRRGAGERPVARADVPALHRRRRRRRAQARDLPPARAVRVRALHGRVARPRRARDAAVSARPVPSRRHGIVLDARARDSDRRVRQQRHRRIPRAAVRGAGPHERLPQAEAQALPGGDEPRHRRFRHLRAAPACARADLAGDRGIERAARPVPAGRDRRRVLRRRRAQQDAARVGGARRGRAAAAVRQSARAVRRQPRAAGQPPERRQAAPGRPAAGARPDVPRHHPFADEGRHGEVPQPVSGRGRDAVRARPRGCRHVLREHLQLPAAQAPVRDGVRQDAAEHRGARARTRAGPAQARHHDPARPARRDEPQHQRWR